MYGVLNCVRIVFSGVAILKFWGLQPELPNTVKCWHNEIMCVAKLCWL